MLPRFTGFVNFNLVPKIKNMKKQDRVPNQNVISREPFPASKKIYVKGKIHDIEVAMREISLEDTMHQLTGEKESNAPVTVYDTSGAYTDTNIEIDLKRGLKRLREEWVVARGDVDQLDGITSSYGQERLNDASLDELRFEHLAKPYRAKKGQNVTQMHYARKGLITPEMEYIAIRENRRIDELNDKGHQHAGNSFGAFTPKKPHHSRVCPSGSSRRTCHYSFQHQPPRK